MTNSIAPGWEKLRTDESREVEDTLLRAGFERADAYRYNPASIRVRVIDSRFEGLTSDERNDLIEPELQKLSEQTQADIMNLFAFAPSELQQSPPTSKEYLANLEFEEPSPSML
jgi:hypothetical protein